MTNPAAGQERRTTTSRTARHEAERIGQHARQHRPRRHAQQIARDGECGGRQLRGWPECTTSIMTAVHGPRLPVIMSAAVTSTAMTCSVPGRQREERDGSRTAVASAASGGNMKARIGATTAAARSASTPQATAPRPRAARITAVCPPPRDTEAAIEAVEVARHPRVGRPEWHELQACRDARHDGRARLQKRREGAPHRHAGSVPRRSARHPRPRPSLPRMTSRNTIGQQYAGCTHDAEARVPSPAFGDAVRPVPPRRRSRPPPPTGMRRARCCACASGTGFASKAAPTGPYAASPRPTNARATSSSR